MTGPDPTERTPTQPPASEAPPASPASPAAEPPPASSTRPPSATPPPSPASPPPASPPPASATPPPAPAAAQPPTVPPAWQPPPADHGGSASLILGIIVLVIGAWFFATRTLGLDLPDLDWGQSWPVILILLGGWIVYRSVRRGR